MIHYCFDHLSDPDLGYPNLAQTNLAPEQFDDTWPRCLPCRLFAYYPMTGLKHRNHLIANAPCGSWYPVALAWHDFDLDYFSLLSETVQQRLRQGEIRLLFYYHEGDNPYRIKERFDRLCHQHNFPRSCYLFLSANTAADKISNMMFFPDHELFFRYTNRHQRIPDIPQIDRPWKFTAVNRVHKWWRATVMADLQAHGVLDQSQWSYNTICDIGDRFEDSPLILEDLPGARDGLKQFLDNGPYWLDSNDSVAHNDHRSVNLDLFQRSYCHLVIETHFDADQSQGCFITEKTYKCLKFGQPFVIIGTQHSLRTLRQQGYRVFDHAIDNSYDDISDNTQRWKAARKAILDICDLDMRSWFESCREDLLHNQHVFSQGNLREFERLEARLDQLSTDTP